MTFPYYTGNPQNRRAEGTRLPGARRARQTDPAGYKPDAGLVDAVNVALLLGQPLLLTGEPGTGKTQLAFSLAWELGLGQPLIFETKSSSTARELFYTYDTLGRFHAAQTKEGSQNSLDYITWNALGRAILLSRPELEVQCWFTPEFKYDGPRRSVVLIDEIDKAPRDFPNDLLNEVEHLYFRVPELGNARIAANEELRPILVLTSNSEKNLPEAFLRRCVFYHIPFPDRDRLTEIVMTRVGSFENSDSRLLKDALDLFFKLREPGSGLRKKPATAELIGWLTTLHAMQVPLDASLLPHREKIIASLGALVKNAEDQAAARTVIAQWQA
ncbi:MAG TPA: MoxR family ATPase [Blastocatellia bacterium]|nr:MoxR family ATPase [Blastocatellia bacterium]